MTFSYYIWLGLRISCLKTIIILASISKPWELQMTNEILRNLEIWRLKWCKFHTVALKTYLVCKQEKLWTVLASKLFHSRDIAYRQISCKAQVSQKRFSKEHYICQVVLVFLRTETQTYSATLALSTRTCLLTLKFILSFFSKQNKQQCECSYNINYPHRNSSMLVTNSVLSSCHSSILSHPMEKKKSTVFIVH